MAVTSTRRLLIAVIGVSGAAALVYQVAWVRLLTAVLGTSAPAVSIVVAVFMAGLAGGATLGGAAADRWPARALSILAIVELGIGAASLGVAVAVPAAGTWLLELLPAQPGRWSTHLLRGGFAAGMLLPPTLLMGSTLTLALRVYAPATERAGAAAGWLYAANTTGAALGTALAGFLLIERLGVQGAVLVAAVANALNALALALRARPPRESGAFPLPEAFAHGWTEVMAQSSALHSRALACLGAGVAGFTGLGLEVVWTRALGYRIGNSTYAFTAVLLAVLVGIAAGSALGARLSARRGVSRAGLALALVIPGLAAAAGLAAIGQMEATTAFEGLLAPWWGPWPAQLVAHLSVTWLVVLPAALALGVVYPLANQLAIDRVDRLGSRSGLVLAVNTVGSVVGALGATYVLVPLFGTVGSLRVIASLPLVVGVALALSVRPRGRIAGVGTAALAALWLVPPPLLRGDQEAPGARVLFEREDPEAHVRLYQNPDGTRHLGVDGWSIGSDAPAFDRKQVLVGLLPFVLREESRSVLIVGLGSGRTLAAVASQSQVEAIDVVEIVPSVVEAARRFSGDGSDPLSDPRVRIHVEDGIHHLAVARRRYDVISSDGKLNPQFAGNAYLYSEEYYRRAREALSADGLLVQWIPLHLPEEGLRMVLRTFVQVFEGRRSVLFFFPPETLLLVGSPAPLDLDAGSIDARLEATGVGPWLQRFGYESGAHVAGARVAFGDALAAAAGPGPRNRWLHPRLEFRVPVALAEKSTPQLEAETLRFLVKTGRASDPLPGDDEEASRVARLRAAGLAVMEGLRDARRAGSYAAAAQTFERAGRLAPDDPRVRWALAAAATERERLETRVRREPGDAEAHRALGRFLYRAGELDAARRSLQRALELAPSSGRAWSDLGDLRSATGDPEGAVDAYERALAQGARRPSLLANLASAQVRAGRLPEARRRLDQALALAPDDAELRNNLGIVQATQGLLGEAESSFRRALRHDPAHLGARNNLAGILLQTGRGEEAVRLYEAALDRDRDNVAVLVNLARAYANEQRWDEADKALNKALDLAPQLDDVRRLRAQLRAVRTRRND